MEIKILGTGCSKCEKLEKNLNKALKELNIDATIEKIDDLVELVSYGVMSTPGFVVNDEVKSVGKALSVKEIKKILTT
ncbi:thioredoxin family protein [Schnuerera sp. xch1]|uniref:thioredoxin family protein n=1 Tax=Schnuerera sp. xch1 TaxID=2874283 RepID=UPI001CBEE29D|nr:thioredoxin family protein [Schnuerera sp. xch1]MBZ2174361.1 thioredoxin family protein [Schnuerera sp. xch1]